MFSTKEILTLGMCMRDSDNQFYNQFGITNSDWLLAPVHWSCRHAGTTIVQLAKTALSVGPITKTKLISTTCIIPYTTCYLLYNIRIQVRTSVDSRTPIDVIRFLLLRAAVVILLDGMVKNRKSAINRYIGSIQKLPNYECNIDVLKLHMQITF